MKIEGGGLSELCEINVRLRSTDIKFQCQFLGVPGTTTFDRDATASIEFKDSYEIDQLIDILQRFKDNNRRVFGEW